MSKRTANETSKPEVKRSRKSTDNRAQSVSQPQSSDSAGDRMVNSIPITPQTTSHPHNPHFHVMTLEQQRQAAQMLFNYFRVPNHTALDISTNFARHGTVSSNVGDVLVRNENRAQSVSQPQPSDSAGDRMVNGIPITSQTTSHPNNPHEPSQLGSDELRQRGEMSRWRSTSGLPPSHPPSSGPMFPQYEVPYGQHPVLPGASVPSSVQRTALDPSDQPEKKKIEEPSQLGSDELRQRGEMSRSNASRTTRIRPYCSTCMDSVENYEEHCLEDTHLLKSIRSACDLLLKQRK